MVKEESWHLKIHFHPSGIHSMNFVWKFRVPRLDEIFKEIEHSNVKIVKEKTRETMFNKYVIHYFFSQDRNLIKESKQFLKKHDSILWTPDSGFTYHDPWGQFVFLERDWDAQQVQDKAKEMLRSYEIHVNDVSAPSTAESALIARNLSAATWGVHIDSSYDMTTFFKDCQEEWKHTCHYGVFSQSRDVFLFPTSTYPKAWKINDHCTSIKVIVPERKDQGFVLDIPCRQNRSNKRICYSCCYTYSRKHGMLCSNCIHFLCYDCHARKKPYPMIQIPDDNCDLCVITGSLRVQWVSKGRSTNTQKKDQLINNLFTKVYL